MSKKLQNTKAVKQLLDGTHKTQTRKSVSFSDSSKSNKRRSIGETWIEKNANGNGIDPFAEVMLAIKGERYSYLFKLRRNKISADNTVYIDQLQFQISKSF